MAVPQHDIVIFGATSFVGRILARFMTERHGAGSELRWALAGRSQARLDEVRRSLGDAGDAVPTVLADAADPAALEAMCAAARVVVTTVGPYALHGEPLVKACVDSGTDYCDLTGEVQWMARMIERYGEAARGSGARLVHCCGFDSVPFDMGVWFIQREALRRFGRPLQRVKMRLKAARGGFSGGTVASILNVAREVSADKALRRRLADPYSLCPPDHPFHVRQHNVSFAEHDEDFGAWSAPFIMSVVNTRVVHRSNALAGAPYGEDFRYDEAVLTGRGLQGRMRATALSAGLGAFMLAASSGPGRGLVQRFFPAPGEGPSEKAQQEGFYDLRFHGESVAGEILRAKVTGDADPGYGSTAKVLGEAAACLAADLSGSEAGGFWTPATLLGEPLLDRLQRHAGLSFEILPDQ